MRAYRAATRRGGLLLAALALFLPACSSTVGPAPSGSATAAGGAGRVPALEFRAATLDGAPFDAAALTGTPVVLWFWAPWCTICRAEAPGVAVVAAEYADRVTFLGVPGRGEVAAMREFVAGTGTGGLTHVVDADGALWQRFGVVAQPLAVPRKLATDHDARLRTAVAGLAAEGTLRTTLRIPNAAGPVSVAADLRTGQIRVSVEIEAPREGTSKRRVSWILRQLAEAPDQLTVEALFARRDQTSCELLKDVRSSAATLLPDPSAEVCAFRLTLSASMGTKRNGLRKAFIPSVHSAVDTFYANVVQGLRP